jgi:hypothetical protein
LATPNNWKLDLSYLIQDVMNAAEVQDWEKIEARANDLKVWARASLRAKSHPQVNDQPKNDEITKDSEGQRVYPTGFLEMIELAKTITEELVFRPTCPNWERVFEVTRNLEVAVNSHVRRNLN